MSGVTFPAVVSVLVITTSPFSDTSAIGKPTFHKSCISSLPGTE